MTRLDKSKGFRGSNGDRRVERNVTKERQTLRKEEESKWTDRGRPRSPESNLLGEGGPSEGTCEGRSDPILDVLTGLKEHRV